MSKKRGLSLDEKRDKVLEVFHESADVFVLKDVEKLAAKKGVVLQSVKEVLQSLVDDDLVHGEKIGISNYFWSFPAEASTKIVNDHEKAREALAAAKRRRVEVAAALAKSKAGKQDVEDRARLMAEVKRLQETVAQQQSELKAFADSDPELVKQMRVATKTAKEAANRWLDNVYALQSWCKKRFEGAGGQLDDFFKENGLKDSMDYLE